jgi:hypothetical protein
LIVGDEREERRDRVGDGSGAAGGGVDEDPVGFAFGQDDAIAIADELIAAKGECPAEVGDPGQDADALPGESGAEVFDVVGADDHIAPAAAMVAAVQPQASAWATAASCIQRTNSTSLT